MLLKYFVLFLGSNGTKFLDFKVLEIKTKNYKFQIKCFYI